MDATNLFPTEKQADLSFPMSLVEKYRPKRIADFIGLETPKAVLTTLLSKPRACNLLFIGPPGSGKTTMALAFASELRAGLIHLASQKLTVDAVAETWERVHYYPESGDYWVVLADEASDMSHQAQIALLSKMDSAATLKPAFGGGFVQGKPLPVVMIFTCNGSGLYGTELPDSFEKKFLSRCLKVEFDTHNLDGQLTDYLRVIWDQEADFEGRPNLEAIAERAGGSVRDALQELELALLLGTVEVPKPREPKPPEPQALRLEPLKPSRGMSLPELLRVDEENFWKARS
ncbi:MAG: AAA family ATPase [Acidobacteriia bacterium]|nr:AAA family ATPase [Terriglobia bacterium]